MQPKQLPGFSYTAQVYDPAQYFAAMKRPTAAQAPAPQASHGLLDSIIRSTLHPFGELGTALAYLPKTVYREVQNKPVGDIQQRVFGTQDSGAIAKKILGDTAQVGLTVASPGANTLAKGAAVGAGFGASNALSNNASLAQLEHQTLTSALMGGALGKIGGALGNRATQAAAGTANKTAGNIAARSFAQAFNVPSKLAPRLKPLETSKEILSHGIGGSLDNMQKVAQSVTGDNGILTNVVRSAVGKIPGDIKTGDVLGSVKNMLDQYPLKDATKRDVLSAVIGTEKPGVLPDFINPVDALDRAKTLESIGYQYINKGVNKMNPSPEALAIGRAYLAGADELTSSLEKTVGSQNILDQFKTPEMMGQLSKISPKLANQFQNAKTLSDVRSIQAPFVKLSQMIGLTNDAAQSVVPSGMGMLGARGGGALIGNALGGPVGAIGGFMAAPFTAGIEQAARAPIATGAAKAINAVAGASGGAGGGKLSSTLSSPLARALEFNAIPPVLNRNSGQSDTADLSSPLPTPPSMPTPLPMTQQASDPYPLAAVMYDIQRDPKNASTYMSLYKTISDVNLAQQKASQSSSATATQSQAKDSILGALGLLDSAENNLVSSGGAKGPVLGELGTIPKAGQYLNPQGYSYHNTRVEIATALAKALSGNSRPAQQMINMYLDSLPDVTDTPRVAQLKLARVRNDVLKQAQAKGLDVSSYTGQQMPAPVPSQNLLQALQLVNGAM